MIKAFVAELQKKPALYAFAGVLLFYTFISFYDWSYNFSFTANAAGSLQHTCWPYFQSCGDLYKLEKPPHGFGINLFFLLVFALWAGTTWAWFYKKLKLLWWGLLLLLGIKIFVAYIYTDSVTSSYDFYHTFFLAIFLLATGRHFFLQVFIALCYLFSATLKIAPEWFGGGAFTDIGGLPLLDLFLPLNVLAVLLFLCFTILPWCLFLGRPYRGFAFVVFSLFHLYTVMVVGFHYPGLILPVLWVLFMLEKPSRPKVSKNVIGWGLLALAALFHMWSFVIPGNEKITGEGVRYGLYMFDTSRHCQSLMGVGDPKDNQWQDLRKDTIWGRRCYVYREWLYVNQRCQYEPGKPIAWKFNFSSNREGPFETLVNTSNVCELEWRPFWHNEWIKLPAETKPWWYTWVWAYWAFNAGLFLWIITRLK